MTSHTPWSRCCVAVLLLCASLAQAQTAPPDATPAGAGSDGDMRIERLKIDESGVRVDETRARGETQSITVTPKGSLPAYSVTPASANRPPSAGARDSIGASGGVRVWKIFGF